MPRCGWHTWGSRDSHNGTDHGIPAQPTDRELGRRKLNHSRVQVEASNLKGQLATSTFLLRFKHEVPAHHIVTTMPTQLYVQESTVSRVGASSCRSRKFRRTVTQAFLCVFEGIWFIAAVRWKRSEWLHLRMWKHNRSLHPLMWQSWAYQLGRRRFIRLNTGWVWKQKNQTSTEQAHVTSEIWVSYAFLGSDDILTTSILNKNQRICVVLTRRNNFFRFWNVYTSSIKVFGCR